jgi:putative spermidine/putrescine transport system substrate-binding protein
MDNDSNRDAAVSAFDRRKFLQRGALLGMGAVAGPSLLAACGDDSSGGSGGSGGGGTGRVVYADGGGTTRDARRKAFLDPFQKKTGIKVVSTDGDSAKFKLMAQRGKDGKKGQWDLADYDGYSLIADLKDGLIQKLPDSVERNDGIPEKYKPYVTGAYSQSIVACYNTDEFPNGGPESWADFWNVKKFPGKRAFPGYFYGAFEAALMADGVPADQIYPLDFDRAIAKLDELRSKLVIYASYGEGQQMLQSGSTPLGVEFNGRVFALQQSGVKLKTVWNESVFYPWSPQAMPVGAPDKENTFKLLDYMAQAPPQAEFAKLTGYGPTNSKALELLPAKVVAELPNGPDHVDSVFTVDQEALAEQIDEYVKRFNGWLAKA